MTLLPLLYRSEFGVWKWLRQRVHEITGQAGVRGVETGQALQKTPASEIAVEPILH
jgi:hypothetical protein